MLFTCSSTIIKTITNFTCVVKEIEIKYGNARKKTFFLLQSEKNGKQMMISQLQLVVLFVDVLKQRT